MGQFSKDFKEFITRGNVVDMAIGVIIGGAFGKIVASLVSDIIMPLIGAVTGGISFKDISYVLSPAVVENGEVIQEANVLAVGNFIDSIFSFLIIALCIFVAIRLVQKTKDKMMGTPLVVSDVEAPKAEDILSDIHELLSYQFPESALRQDEAKEIDEETVDDEVNA